jgi:hypothetical protein
MGDLTLKWGTVKGWDGLDDAQISILDRFFKDGMSASCALDHPDASRRELLCELIDTIDGEIWNDWDGRVMTKEDAKKYVREYGAKP